MHHMRILIIGNSDHFIDCLTTLFQSDPSASLRLHETIYELEILRAAGEIEAASVWGMEAVQSDGIIFALM